MGKVILTALVVLTFCGCEENESGKKGNPAAEKAAAASAEAWLWLVDAGRYADSWEQAASSFRANIAKEAWLMYFRSLREPLGRMVSRELISTSYTKSLPGAPKGEYVVIQYSTFFEKRRFTIETVTPMLDEDGAWRVSGNQIK